MDQTHRKMSLMPCMLLAVQVAGSKYFHKMDHLLSNLDPYFLITWSPKWSIIKRLTAKHIWGEHLISQSHEPLLKPLVKHYFNVVGFPKKKKFREKIKDCLLLDDEEAVWISKCFVFFQISSAKACFKAERNLEFCNVFLYMIISRSQLHYAIILFSPV